MGVTFEPTSTNCLLKYLEDANTSTTASGLEIKDDRNVKLSYKAEIVALGPDVEEKTLGLSKGDKVIFKWHQNHDLESSDIGGEPDSKYTVIDVEKLLCKVD